MAGQPRYFKRSSSVLPTSFNIPFPNSNFEILLCQVLVALFLKIE